MKKKIILSIAIIILVALTALVSIYITNNQKEQEEKNKEEFSKNIINPDRIIYKNQEKYYEIKPENEIYNNRTNVKKNRHKQKRNNNITRRIR